jgi:hypothetical protein
MINAPQSCKRRHFSRNDATAQRENRQSILTLRRCAAAGEIFSEEL